MEITNKMSYLNAYEKKLVSGLLVVLIVYQWYTRVSTATIP